MKEITGRGRIAAGTSLHSIFGEEGEEKENQIISDRKWTGSGPEVKRAV